MTRDPINNPAVNEWVRPTFPATDGTEWVQYSARNCLAVLVNMDNPHDVIINDLELLELLRDARREASLLGHALDSFPFELLQDVAEERQPTHVGPLADLPPYWWQVAGEAFTGPYALGELFILDSMESWNL